MPEWVYERGIGECRAALIERGRILEMAIEPDGDGPRAGAVAAARLIRNDLRTRPRAELADGTVVLLVAPPPGVSEGGAFDVEIVREALPLPYDPKPALGRPAAPGTPHRHGAALRDRIAASGHGMISEPSGVADALEAAGWSEALEEAASGIVMRADCLLRISLTPAMTVIDVDGAPPLDALAIAGARAGAAAIRRFGLAGSIGIDLPTLASRADRQAAAAAFDATLPPPFERTGVNGFGFLQIVRRRTRMSVPERLAADPAGHAARALLRRAERASGRGGMTLIAAPPVVALLDGKRGWIDMLARRIGASVCLRADGGLSISAGHAQYDHP